MATKTALGSIKGNTDMYDASGVEELAAAATSGYYEGTRDEDETDAAVLARITEGATVTLGSTAVIITELEGGEESRTAFTYGIPSGETTPEWMAMDGNYTSDNVFFQDDLTITANIGVKTIGSSGSATIAAKGKNLTTVLKSILAKEKYPATPSQPSATVTLTNAGSYECGTPITPEWKTTFSAGSYTYGPATGITSTAATVYHGTTSDSDADAVTAGNLNNATGTFDAIVLTAGQDFYAKLNWGSTAGATPKTNLGNNATEDIEECEGTKVSAIAAKSNQTATSSNKISGYRMGRFYGTSTNVVAADSVTSAIVRGLSNKSDGTSTTGSFTFTVPVGAKTIIIAVFGSRTLSKVLNTTVNADMTTSFTKATNLLSVCGADAPATTNAGDYSVWTYSPAEAYGTAASLTVTIA